MPAAASNRAIDYGRDVRPILSEHCYECHGPDVHKRGLRLDTAEGSRAVLPSGSRAVVPGKPDESELVRRITHADPGERMPPESQDKRLTPRDIEVLRQWIAEGAEFARHWSFTPLSQPDAPFVTDPLWARNPIDSFVFARLDTEGLAPSPPASREAILRRVTYDLTGLPPTPAEVEAFVADDRPGSYARVVDRLLASESYGEHMARQWLDVARYGDTHGFHLDNVRSLWPWRDWVIAAFNANMPFDRFTIEQLAGDLLPDPTDDQRIATGFNRCNPTTGEGGLIEEEYLVKYAIDRVETTGAAWLGLTVGCAQCHDHKYDPISQREFYRLFAFFNNVAEQGTDRNALTPPPSMRVASPEKQSELAALQAEIDAVTRELAAPMPELDARQVTWEKEQVESRRQRWRELHPLSSLSRGGATMRILDDHSVLVSGESPNHDVYEVVARTDASEITTLRLEALTDASQPGGGVGRASHSNIVLSGFAVEAAPASNPLAGQPVELTAATADYSQRNYDIGRSLDGNKTTGWAIDGGKEDRTAVFATAAPFGFAGGTVVRVRMRFESNHPQHTIGRFRLSVSSDPATAPARLGPWQTVGPFAAADGKTGFDTAYGPESDPDLAQTYDAGTQKWEPRPAWTDGKVHRFTQAVGATYLQRTIDSPGQHPVTLSFGSDDAIKVWLNGELVHQRLVQRGAGPDQERVTARLRAGGNRLLVKIVNYNGPSGFYFRVISEEVQLVPATVLRAALVPTAERTEAHEERLRGFFRREHSAEWRALEQKVAELGARHKKKTDTLPRTMIMQERKERRPTHVLVRGQYDNKADRVDAGVPAILPPLVSPEGKEATRLDLARWLVAPDHPLTARVVVNRFWASVFGTGIVKTVEDFGSRGEWPSHPGLLDWLAAEFVRSGWDTKQLLRLMLTSATYRQSAAVSPELLARDRENRLLARGPRFRLDAEAIRDTALALGGLLVGDVGGPSVKPYQPMGIWKAVGYTSSNTANFKQDHGDALYRRSMYTFWKRTAPPPTMALFDAPSREACTVLRARTNTPLQALVLLNDKQFVEAARAFGQRMMREGGDDPRARILFGFRSATARYPDAGEVDVLLHNYAGALADFRVDPAAAAALVAVGESKPDASLNVEELAAWTTVASILLNLDETITKD